jgi:hypothetical protein
VPHFRRARVLTFALLPSALASQLALAEATSCASNCVHLRLSAGPRFGYTSTHALTQVSAPGRARRALYPVDARGFGQSIELGAGVSFGQNVLGGLMETDLSPVRSVGPAATAIGLEPVSELLERTTFSLFQEYRLETLPLFVGGSVGWASLYALHCCRPPAGFEITAEAHGGSGPSVGLWLGAEQRWGDYFRVRATLRGNGMRGSYAPSVLEAHDVVTSALGVALTLGVTVN